MDPIRYVYFAASYNLALWTVPKAYEMIGKDLCLGIWWVATVSYCIIRRFRPKPLPDVIDVEFREIKSNYEEVKRYAISGSQQPSQLAKAQDVQA